MDIPTLASLREMALHPAVSPIFKSVPTALLDAADKADLPWEFLLQECKKLQEIDSPDLYLFLEKGIRNGYSLFKHLERAKQDAKTLRDSVVLGFLYASEARIKMNQSWDVYQGGRMFDDWSRVIHSFQRACARFCDVYYGKGVGDLPACMEQNKALLLLRLKLADDEPAMRDAMRGSVFTLATAAQCGDVGFFRQLGRATIINQRSKRTHGWVAYAILSEWLVRFLWLTPTKEAIEIISEQYQGIDRATYNKAVERLGLYRRNARVPLSRVLPAATRLVREKSSSSSGAVHDTTRNITTNEDTMSTTNHQSEILERLRNRQETAHRIGVSPRSILRYEQSGLLPAVRINSRTIRYREADIQAFIESSVSRREVA